MQIGKIEPKNMMQQFQEFRQMFSGDPEQMVKWMLNSGKMTEDQLKQLKGMADQYAGMFRR